MLLKRKSIKMKKTYGFQRERAMRYYSQKPLQNCDLVKTVALSTVHYLRIRLVPITAVLLVRTLETCSARLTYLHIREHI